MRLWSIHPTYLDAKGFVALWREGLLAKKVLEGNTKGYKNHPQLERFKTSKDPIGYINAYLYQVLLEAERRGYRFDKNKIEPKAIRTRLVVTAPFAKTQRTGRGKICAAEIGSRDQSQSYI